MFRTLVISLVLTVAAAPPLSPLLCKGMCPAAASTVPCHQSAQTVLVGDACDHEVAAVAVAVQPGTGRNIAAADSTTQNVSDAGVAGRSAGDLQRLSSERPPGTPPRAANLRI